MKRQRHIPADPARSTAHTCDAIVGLIAEALPRAEGVREELARGRGFFKYLVATESLAATPLVLSAGENLECEIFTVHGTDALAAEAVSAPPGGAHATTWLLVVPVPAGAPFTAADVERASSHFATSGRVEKSDASAVTSASSGSLFDPDELRKAVR